MSERGISRRANCHTEGQGAVLCRCDGAATAEAKPEGGSTSPPQTDYVLRCARCARSRASCAVREDERAVLCVYCAKRGTLVLCGRRTDL